LKPKKLYTKTNHY